MRILLKFVFVIHITKNPNTKPYRLIKKKPSVTRNVFLNNIQ